MGKVDVGDKFGSWEVIVRAASRNGSSYWLCRCLCGKEREVWQSDLTRGRSTACRRGCAARLPIGTKVNKLTIINQIGYIDGSHHVLVRCDCGKEVEHIESRVKNGAVKSCGCLTIEKITGNKYGVTHGESVRGTNSALWATWKAMKNRCNSDHPTIAPNYKLRGITYCEKWADYLNFKEDILNSIGDKPKPSPKGKYTLDRINNDGNYEPGNVRWATYEEQYSNRRKLPSGKFHTFNGETHNIEGWAERNGFDTGTYYQRIRRGWSIEAALTTPGWKEQRTGAHLVGRAYNRPKKPKRRTIN